MTCVLPTTTPCHHLSDHLPWSAMTTDAGPSPTLPDRERSRRNASPSSDTWKSSSSSGKKRASRAGTRSVTTLSASQLERKRANDREAQRAVRQRTKDHIDHLERSIGDLRGSQEANEELIQATRQRNRELEEENAYLRSKLTQTGAFAIDLLQPENQRSTEHSLMSMGPTSAAAATGSSVQRPGSTSALSVQSAGFMGRANTAAGLSCQTAMAGSPSLSTWRPHDSPHADSPYLEDQRLDWSGNTTPYQQYVSQEQQIPQQYATASSQQSGYQTPLQSFGASVTPQLSPYHAQLNAPNDFSNISASSSPSTYHVTSQPVFQQPPTSFPVTPMMVPCSGAEYSSPHSQMQPSPLPSPSFHAAHLEQAYAAQQSHAQIPYHDETVNRFY